MNSCLSFVLVMVTTSSMIARIYFLPRQSWAVGAFQMASNVFTKVEFILQKPSRPFSSFSLDDPSKLLGRGVKVIELSFNSS